MVFNKGIYGYAAKRIGMIIDYFWQRYISYARKGYLRMAVEVDEAVYAYAWSVRNIKTKLINWMGLI